MLPNEIYAAQSPQCSFSMDTRKYSSASDYASSVLQETGISASVGGSFSDFGFSASVSASFKNDQSVSVAHDTQQKQSGSIAVTQASCETVKVEIDTTDFTSFHPSFLKKLYTATAQTMPSIINEYGTHYYKHIVLGGKLMQVTSTSYDYINT